MISSSNETNKETTNSNPYVMWGLQGIIPGRRSNVEVTPVVAGRTKVSDYAGMQSSTAVLHDGDDVASCHLRIRRGLTSMVWPFDTHLASGLCQVRPKYVFVRYRDLAYVSHQDGIKS